MFPDNIFFFVETVLNIETTVSFTEILIYVATDLFRQLSSIFNEYQVNFACCAVRCNYIYKINKC